MPTASVPVRVDPVRAWLERRLGDLAGIDVGRRTPLAGGLASPSVHRVEVTAIGPEGRRTAYPVVTKRASAVEALALRQLADVPDTRTFPPLIDDGTDEHGPWVVLPFYGGGALAWNDPLPPQVLADLARLHAYGRDRLDTVPAHVERIGPDFITHALTGFASDGLAQAARRSRNPDVFSGTLRMLRRWADEALLTSVVGMLDVSVLHGDAYGPNVVRVDDPDGDASPEAADATAPYRLVDWGNLRVGPVLFDVLMTMDDVDSDGFAAYLRAWHDATGEPFDPYRLRLGTAWARAFVRATFAGTVADRFGLARGQAMIRAAERSYDELRTLLATV